MATPKVNAEKLKIISEGMLDTARAYLRSNPNLSMTFSKYSEMISNIAKDLEKTK